MVGRGGIYGDMHGDGQPVGRPAPVKCDKHSWSDWKDIGRTGDWFKPIIVERRCKNCPATETDEH